jgi:uncharacterized BrkB/YihY/UPF0761 family membrane protein
MALNMIWEVKPDPGINIKNVARVIREQFISFLMVLGVSGALVALMFAGTALGILETHLIGILEFQEELAATVVPIEESLSSSVEPLEETLASSVEPLEETLSSRVGTLEEPLSSLLDSERVTAMLDSVRNLQGLELRFSFVVATILFALVYKYVPNASITWRDVWIGALLAGLLFVLGRLAIAVYLSYATVTTAYGAAGSLIVILLWINYMAQIVFFGAEFTKMYSHRYGSRSPAFEAEASSG